MQTVMGLPQSSYIATIPNGGALSGAVDLTDRRAVLLVAPAAWTPAPISFAVSHDGNAWGDLFDEFGNVVSYALTGGVVVRLPAHDMIGIRFLKIRSGTANIPINQGGTRSIIIVAQG